MNETLLLVLSGVAGGMLGALFFGGLWWTVKEGVSARQPALWMTGSLLVRMGITLVGFYLVAGGHWERMLACLAGFLLSRLVVLRLTRPAGETRARPAEEARHAP